MPIIYLVSELSNAYVKLCTFLGTPGIMKCAQLAFPDANKMQGVLEFCGS